ncbi:MAG: divalent-cation tolerance protein CutA [Vulcanimicrobiota bacterium]
MYITIFVTVPDEKTGETIARNILKERLAACANMVKQIRSFYWWEDEIQDDQEYLLIIKTKLGLFNNLKETIVQLHPYDVPEIVAMPIIKGHEPYLKWLSNETKFTECDPGARGIVF